MNKVHALVGTALAASMIMPAIAGAQVTTTTVGTSSMATTTTTAPAMKKGPNIACIQTAIDKRDGSIVVAHDALAATVRAAIIKRTGDLKAGWAMTGEKDRRKAVMTAWKAFEKSKSAVRKEYAKSQRMAWNDFYKDRKACQASASDDMASHAVDNL